MDDHEKRLRGITKKLSGLKQCVSEMENTEADLLKALGAGTEKRDDAGAEQLSIEIEQFLFVLANAVEAREQHTHGHIERVVNLTAALGGIFELRKEDARALKMGAILHDIGKIGLPVHLLDNPGSLTPGELEPMKNHPEIGYQICLSLKNVLGRALDIIRQHHEKLDGTGYPFGLKGDEIYLGTRIMTVVDIYDALITDRPYRKGMSGETALAILHQDAVDGKLDVDVVNSLTAFLGARQGACLIV